MQFRLSTLLATILVALSMEARASPLGPAPRSICVPGQHRCVGIAIVRIPTLFTSNRLRANLCIQGEWSCILGLFPFLVSFGVYGVYAESINARNKITLVSPE